MDAGPTVIAAKQLRYDTNTIMLHWLTAGLIVILWLSGQLTDIFGHGEPVIYTVSFHATLGVALGLVLVVRVIWRLTNGRSLPGANSGLLEIAARATHYALYLLIGGTVLLGLLTVWARGQNVWGWFTLPMLDPTNDGLRHQLRGLHGLAANVIGILAGLHAAAALFHHYVLRDGVLRRMLPR